VPLEHQKEEIYIEKSIFYTFKELTTQLELLNGAYGITTPYYHILSQNKLNMD